MQVLGLVEVPWWALLLLTIIAYLLYTCRDFNYFRKQGIAGQMPIPIFGTTFYAFKKIIPVMDVELVKSFADKGIIGEFFGSIPSLLVFDENLLSEIMVKEFTSFTNRMSFRSNGGTSDKMLTNLDDDHWKHVRHEMTPTFTTGKLKKMNSEINRCSKTLGENLLQRAKLHENIEAKDYTGGFAMDVIASTAFGIRVDSQKDRNNAFVKHARKAFGAFSPLDLKMFLRLFFPELAFILIKLGVEMEIIAKDIRDFFSKITNQTIKMRKSDVDQSKTDFIQLMINKQRGEDIDDKYDEDAASLIDQGSFTPGLTTDEILANAIVFFVAGYDTTATSLSFLFYNLAVNQDCQNKLVEEIKRVVGDQDYVDYNLLQNMPYLEKCINENLRMCPPGTRVNRKVKKDTTINAIFFRKDTYVQIPVFGIHHDPKKWPKPEEFDPERFSAENKKDRNPYWFLPFGNGPRNCIGMRLALMELKMGAIHALKRVKFMPCEKTKIPIKYATDSMLLLVEGGLWLKVEPRD